MKFMIAEMKKKWERIRQRLSYIVHGHITDITSKLTREPYETFFRYTIIIIIITTEKI